MTAAIGSGIGTGADAGGTDVAGLGMPRTVLAPAPGVPAGMASGNRRRLGVEDDALGAVVDQKWLPLARAIIVTPIFCANSSPFCVTPERDSNTGMPICATLMTISEVSRPVV